MAEQKKVEHLPEFEVFVRLMKTCGYDVDDVLQVYAIMKLMLDKWTEEDLKKLEGDELTDFLDEE